jgi:hypothetical protein
LITCFGVRNTRLAATASAQVGKNFFNYFFAILSGTLVASAALAADLPPPVVGEDWRTLEARTRPAQLPLVSDTGFEVGLGALDPDNLAAPRPAPAFDLTGVWAFRRYAGADADVHGHFNFLPLPTFTPKGQAFYDEFKRFEAAGRRHLEPTAFCHPAGMPRLQTRVGSLMMLQYPTAIYMVSRLNNEYRTIYLDGRPRIDYAIREPNYLGESIGHWEGDTLVVDTVGFNEKMWFDSDGSPHTDQLHLIEKFTRISLGRLKYEVTIDDPGAYTSTWSSGFYMDWTPGESFQFVCQDENLASELMVGSGEYDSIDRSQPIFP